MVDKLLQLSCNTLAHFLPVDEGKLLKDLNENFMVRELGMIASGLSLNYGKYMAIASAALPVNNEEIDSSCRETD